MAEHSRSGGSHSHRSDPASSNHPRGLLASFAAPARPRSGGEDMHHTLTFGTLVVLTFKEDSPESDPLMRPYLLASRLYA